MYINLANIDFGGEGGKKAVLQETTIESLLTETTKVVTPPEGVDGFNKVTVTHAPVEESVSATITENGTHTISPSAGFGAMVGVNVDVNIPSVTDDKIQYFNEKPTADDTGLKAIGWDDDSINYFKYNNYVYPWEANNYKVSDANKQITINSVSDIANYKDNPDFQYCPVPNDNVISVGNYGFEGCKYIKGIPLYDKSGRVLRFNTLSRIFAGCVSLTSIPPINTRYAEQMTNTFESCANLTSLPLLDTSNVYRVFRAFRWSGLTTIPLFDFSNVTDMEEAFSLAKNLKYIPPINTSKVTTMRKMFSDCESLENISQLDTSNVTNMSSMFSGCKVLTTIPQLDTSNVTNMYDMFYFCSSLVTIPQLDTSKVTSMGEMFYYCTSLVSVPKLDATNLTSANSMFNLGYGSNKFTDFGGLTNLKIDLDLSKCSKLTHDSLLNVINEAADVTSSPQTLTLGATNLAKLTDEEKAIATSKGWTLA